MFDTHFFYRKLLQKGINLLGNTISFLFPDERKCKYIVGCGGMKQEYFYLNYGEVNLTVWYSNDWRGL